MDTWARLQACHAVLQDIDVADQNLCGLEQLAEQFNVSDQLPELQVTRQDIDGLRASVVGIVQLLLVPAPPAVH